MDPKKLEMLLSVTMMVLKMLILAQKAGLLVRGRASSAIREEMDRTIEEAERILAKVEEMFENGSY